MLLATLVVGVVLFLPWSGFASIPIVFGISSYGPRYHSQG